MEQNNDGDGGLGGAISNHFKGSPIIDNPEMGTVLTEKEVKTEEKFTEQPPVTEKTQEAKSDVKAESKDSNSSLNTEVKVETPESKKEPQAEVKTPSFEELLTEKSQGKYKDWSELEKALNEPKNEFADDFVKQINDLRKEGVKFDENWLHTVSKDYDSETDPIALLAEKWQIEEPGITEDEIVYRLKKEYETESWSKEEGEEPTEAERALGAKMLRDAEKAKQFLIDHQAKLKISPKQENDQLKQQQAEQDLKLKTAWEQDVDKTLPSLEKISIKVNDKETFDIPVDKADLQEVSKIAKELWTNSNALWKDHVTDKSTNASGIMSMILKAKMFEKAITHARNKGAETIVKEQKNVNFNPDGKAQGEEKLSAEQLKQKAIAESVASKLLT